MVTLNDNRTAYDQDDFEASKSAYFLVLMHGIIDPTAAIDKIGQVSYHSRMLSTTVVNVCIVLITIAVWFGLVFFIFTLLQLRRAANAVEALAYHLQDGTAKLHNFATTVRSGWMRALEMCIAAATSIWGDRRHAEAGRTRRASRSEPEDNNG